MKTTLTALTLVILIALAGCGGNAAHEPSTAPIFTSSHGVRYYGAAAVDATPLTLALANDQEDQLLEIYPDRAGCMGIAWIELTDHRLDNGHELVDGLEHHERLQVYGFASTLAPSSWMLRHELLHWLLECTTGDPDHDHRGPDWIFVGGVPAPH